MVLTRKPAEEKKLSLLKCFHLCIYFISKQNGWKLKSFIYIFSKDYFINGNQVWPTLFIKKWFVFPVEINKNCYWNCCPCLSNRHRSIWVHPTSWQWHLKNYLPCVDNLALLCPHIKGRNSPFKGQIQQSLLIICTVYIVHT